MDYMKYMKKVQKTIGDIKAATESKNLYGM
jgi:hypothetical protein